MGPSRFVSARSLNQADLLRRCLFKTCIVMFSGNKSVPISVLSTRSHQRGTTPSLSHAHVFSRVSLYGPSTGARRPCVLTEHSSVARYVRARLLCASISTSPFDLSRALQHLLGCTCMGCNPVALHASLACGSAPAADCSGDASSAAACMAWHGCLHPKPQRAGTVRTGAAPLIGLCFRHLDRGILCMRRCSPGLHALGPAAYLRMGAYLALGPNLLSPYSFCCQAELQQQPLAHIGALQQLAREYLVAQVHRLLGTALHSSPTKCCGRLCAPRGQALLKLLLWHPDVPTTFHTHARKKTSMDEGRRPDGACF